MGRPYLFVCPFVSSPKVFNGCQLYFIMAVYTKNCRAKQLRFVLIQINPLLRLYGTEIYPVYQNQLIVREVQP
jgi:hypothetical protein